MNIQVIFGRNNRAVRTLTLSLILTIGLALAALTLALLGRARPARAAILCVRPDGGPDCEAAIGDALALAQQGDLIQVAAGTYTENVHITQTVTLQGGWNSDFSVRDLETFSSTITPADNTQSVVSIQGQFADTAAVAPTLDGFVITGGRADLGSNHGGGVSIRNSDAEVISNTIIENAAFLLGGGIWVQNGAPHIEGNHIERNASFGNGQQAYGGGVQLENAGATLVDNMITHNVVSGTQAYGGGIDMVGGQNIALLGNVIFSNTAGVPSATGFGGGFMLRNATVDISNTQVRENWSSTSGGGIAVIGGSFNMNASTVISNRAVSRGGAIFAHDTTSLIQMLVISSTLSNNYANYGGAVYAQAQYHEIQTTLSATVFAANVAGGPGGAIDNLGIDGAKATLVISSTRFSENASDACGGAICNYVDGGQAILRISASEFISNTTADDGGAIDNYDLLSLQSNWLAGNMAVASGGGVYNRSVLSVTDTAFQGNLAGHDGGGIFNTLTGFASIDGGELTGNDADWDQDGMGDGGGIYNMGQVSIQGSTLYSNTAASFGGGIFNQNTLTLTHGTLNQNQADDGGGLFTEGGSATSIYTSTVRDNTTVMGGGAGINSNGQLTIQASTFSGNRALSTNGNGGGILNNDVAEITNSTVSGNVAGGFGGGLRNAGTLTLTNVSVFSNTGVLGAGGVQNMDTVLAVNTILAANGPDNCVGAVTSLGHNLEDADDCSLMPGLNDQVDTDPQAGTLGDNGGDTFTHATPPGSPAIDAGDNAACPSQDQRGSPRPLDGDDNGSAFCDVGAYEYNPAFFSAFLPMVVR